MIFEMLIIAFLMVVAIVLILLAIFMLPQLPVLEDSFLLPAACSMPIRSVRRSAM